MRVAPVDSSSVIKDNAVGSKPTYDELKDVFNWLKREGITPHPCKPKSKATIGELSTAAIYGNRDEDSFFVPTPERLQRITQFWDTRDIATLTPDDLSVSIQNAAGYNNGRPFVWIDADDPYLVAAFEGSEVLEECIVMRGSKGCKLGTFVDANGSSLNSPQWFTKASLLENKPAVELINNKHGVVWGRHPNDVVSYKIVRGLNEPIPTLQWGNVLSEVSRIASDYGLKTREQFALTTTNGTRKRRDSLGDHCPISLRDVSQRHRGAHS